MNDNKWENIIFMIEEKFGIAKRYREKIEVAQDSSGQDIFGEKECIEFDGLGGKMKIERIGKPKVIDKKVLSTKRVGGKVAVDYIYGDEMSYRVVLSKLDEKGEWQPVDLTALV